MVEIIVFERGLVNLSANFRGMGSRSPTAVGVRKLVPVLSRCAVSMILGLAILVEQPTCVRQTNRQTHDDGKYRANTASRG